ncbi:MAG: hypothetical protein COA79_13360 [Planctomycetota bacterium]|nr:MAG: hypothetical protein COA79_13360 [Planctomycetota bacterium]
MFKKNNRSSFSLVELMVVILILALMSTVVVIGLNHMLPGAKMNSQSRRLAGMIGYLYENSITTGKLFGLRYNTSENYYEVQLLWKVSEEDKKKNNFEEAERFGRRYLPEGVRFKEINDDFGQSVPRDNESLDVRFDPSGYITPHRIHLIDEDENEITLEVTFLSGQVIFHDGYFEPVNTLEKVVQ